MYNPVGIMIVYGFRGCHKNQQAASNVDMKRLRAFYRFMKQDTDRKTMYRPTLFRDVKHVVF